MTKVVIDKSIRSTFSNLGEQIELCDETGRTLGYFLPAELHRQLLRAWAETQISDEELERRRNEPGGRTLDEIWSRLKGK
ncbi:MAG TPA: hypothetical protein VGY55_03325 [Pirellulales bacterium]|nr:hypothetical protein [Pirellulales bacterium]